MIAEKAGSAEITLTLSDKRTLKLELTVLSVSPKKVKINQGKKKTLTVGDALQLTTTVSPEFCNKGVKWHSNKPKVATVNAAGLVRARGAGTAKITATAGGKTATITVKVKKGKARVELSDYVGKPANKVAGKLKLKWNRAGQGSWGLKGLSLGDYSDPYPYGIGMVDYIYLTSDGKQSYTLGGVVPGMTWSKAQKVLRQNGWEENPAYTGDIGAQKWVKQFVWEKHPGFFALRFTVSGKGKVTAIRGSKYPLERNMISLCVGQTGLNADGTKLNDRFYYGTEAINQALKETNGKTLHTSKYLNITAGRLLSLINDDADYVSDRDVFILYVTAHGQGVDREHAHKGDLVLDAKSFMSLSVLARAIRMMRGTKVVLLDSCLSGRALDVPDFRDDRIILFVGCDRNEESFGSDYDEGNGFSVVMAEAIRDLKGDNQPKDGVLTVEEFVNYVTEKTIDKAYTQKFAQHPQAIYSNPDFPLFWK